MYEAQISGSKHDGAIFNSAMEEPVTRALANCSVSVHQGGGGGAPLLSEESRTFTYRAKVDARPVESMAFDAIVRAGCIRVRGDGLAR